MKKVILILSISLFLFGCESFQESLRDKPAEPRTPQEQQDISKHLGAGISPD